VDFVPKAELVGQKTSVSLVDQRKEGGLCQ